MPALDQVTMGCWLRDLERGATLGMGKEEEDREGREDWEKEPPLELALKEGNILEKWGEVGPEEELWKEVLDW